MNLIDIITIDTAMTRTARPTVSMFVNEILCEKTMRRVQQKKVILSDRCDLKFSTFKPLSGT